MFIAMNENGYPNTGKKILVIEDDDQIRKLLVRLLTRFGYVVEEAANGKTGVEHFRKSPADLLITDIFMPDQNGIETITQLKKDFPNLKIIAMSGGARGGSFDFLPLAKSLGANNIIKKPFKHEEILSVVRELLLDQEPKPEGQ